MFGNVHLFVLLAFLWPWLAQAQEVASPPSEKKILHALAKPAPPFVFSGEKPSGFTIDLWQRVAKDANLAFEISVANTLPELIERLKDQQADVGLGAISITSEREAVIDFSHPFFDSGLQIMTRASQTMSIFSSFRAVAGDLLKVIGILLLALLVNAHLLWMLERRRNPDNFPAAYPQGVWEAGWWSICTLVTGGCENIAPAAVGGRLLAVVWMLTGIGLVSFVTAKMASIMTVNTLTSEIQKVSDLRGALVGTVRGSTAQRDLESELVQLRTYANVQEAVEALEQGDLRAVIYDAPVLRYYLVEHPKARLQLVGAIFEKQRYGLALQQASPYRKEINQVLLRLEEEGFFESLERKWFPPADSSAAEK